MLTQELLKSTAYTDNPDVLKQKTFPARMQISLPAYLRGRFSVLRLRHPRAPSTAVLQKLSRKLEDEEDAVAV